MPNVGDPNSHCSRGPRRGGLASSYLRSHLDTSLVQRLHDGACGETDLGGDLSRGQLFVHVKVNREREFIITHLPRLLNLDSAVDQMLTNSVMVDAQLSRKAFDRFDFLIGPNELIDLLGQQLRGRGSDSASDLWQSILRFSLDPQIHKRFSGHAMFGRTLQELHH